MGTKCNKPCTENKYGPDCTETCKCPFKSACRATDGKCECKSGWQGINCTERKYNQSE